MRSIFNKNLFFLLPYIVCLLVGAFLLLVNTKADLHLFFNHFHNPLLDHLFPYITLLGDGFTAVAIILIFLFIKYRHALVLGFSYALSALITQVLKHYIFEDMLRPKNYFEELNQPIYLIPGIENHAFNSFPSGHSTTAFAIYFCMATFTGNNVLKSICFFMALLVAVSRVYLSQHFFEDIYAGSLIGVTVSFFTVYVADHSPRLNQALWINKSLFRNK